MEAHIFMPRDTPRANIIECEQMGAHVTLINGLITDCGAEVAKRQPVHHAEGVVRDQKKAAFGKSKNPTVLAIIKLPEFGNLPQDAFKELGNGIIPMEPILVAAKAAGVVHCHVEQDQSPDAMASIAQSIAYLTKL